MPSRSLFAPPNGVRKPRMLPVGYASREHPAECPDEGDEGREAHG